MKPPSSGRLDRIHEEKPFPLASILFPTGFSKMLLAMTFAFGDTEGKETLTKGSGYSIRINICACSRKTSREQNNK